MSALSQEEAKIISDLSQSHVPPKKILANLRQNGLGLDAYSKQIYNEKAKLKRLSRGDRTVMKHLIGLLEEHNYYKWFRTDETTHAVTDLMWAHPQSVELLSKFPYVLLLDSTYKTNQYKLPLLEIVGVTPVGKIFTVAVAFLRHENEDHYTWVLQKLKRLFPPQTLPSAIVTDRELGLIKALENVFPTVPHLLCLWHINMNDWMDVRMDVYNCIKTHEEFFKDYFGGGNLVYRVLVSVAYWDNAPSPYEKWMTITDVGVVVATYYNALVLSASSLGNQTYLPLWAPEGVSQLSYEMTILFLESGSHFVYVKMNDNCPLPPFDRQWARYSNNSVAYLPEALRSRREMWDILNSV
ncbi:PREDICTED: protein FAR-RED ELONGATED HYPOCOTYL 3-like [Erythranthe guttata]|uniref:protein FAR-RED ELONGATED HYPOCOTYL 3-like n=1 Tax=Erythranthe guttata TaxID=4155 RepID=UPI00064DC4FC|nr:PREDICTED: protein FAR-RED ELONGATED HYPOCOTYL 3-like [Erythranthe guttata]|eukprot:XP_012833854.1 PREDICTED: protein FAR-RED ELONGATED HYPOCOTYL 3-like [Erythranthe guttata]